MVLAEPLRAPGGGALLPEGHVFDARALGFLRGGRASFDSVRLTPDVGMDRWALRKAYKDLVALARDIAALHAETSMEVELSLLISRVRLVPEVARHLSVMQARYPRVFEKTLLGAWLAGVLAQRMELSKSERAVCFLAALLRDLGMLYVRSDLVERAGEEAIPARERRAIRDHVEWGAKLAAKLELKDAHLIAEGVREHHERLDGTGYPSMLREDAISTAGRVVAFADVVAAVRLKQGIERSPRLSEMVEILLFEQDGFDRRIFAVFAELSRLVGPQELLPESVERRAARLVGRAKTIGEQTGDITEQLDWPGRTEESFAPGLVHRARRTLRAMIRSGHADNELMWWLKLVAAGKEEAEEAELNEVEHQQLEALRKLEQISEELNGGELLTHADVRKPQHI